MIKVLKHKENVIRCVVDKKKCAIVFGIKEMHTQIKKKNTRNKKETKEIKGLFKVLNEEDREALGEEINEIQREGKYLEGGEGSLRIKFKFQTAATKVMQTEGKGRK